MVGRPLEVALAGCGHMGRHHARTVARHPQWRLVAVVDPVAERAQAVAAETGAAVERALPSSVDAVIVASSTPSHVQVAGPALARGQWCLVEKPVTGDSALAKALPRDRLVVGHCERYNPAVRALGPVRPTRVDARRHGTACARNEGADVVLDLMIHDLDLLIHWGFDPELLTVRSATGTRRGGSWASASVWLEAPGRSARLSASRVADAPHRGVALVDSQGRSAQLDLIRGRVQRSGVELPPPDADDALTAQWSAFTARIRGEGSPGEEPGIRALELAERLSHALVELP